MILFDPQNLVVIGWLILSEVDRKSAFAARSFLDAFGNILGQSRICSPKHWGAGRVS